MPRLPQRGVSDLGSKGERSPTWREAPSPVPRVRALEFIRPMRGASQPHLLRCDDEENYVVKFQNNPQHVRVLANEMLASRLAQRVGLPVPPPALVDVPPELAARHPFHGIEPRRREVAAGLQFGSRFPGAPSQTLVVDFLPDRLLRGIKEMAAVFLGGFVFDKWTCNCDGRQVIFHRGGDQQEYTASLIDHGFCFNDGEWNFPDSPIRSLYPRRLVYESVRGLGSFEPFLSRIENLTAAELEACAEETPPEWCGEDGGRLDRLLERLYERRRLLRQAIVDAKNSALRPFPNWK